MRDDQADLGVFGKRWAEAELALKLVQFVSIMLYVLVAGVMWNLAVLGTNHDRLRRGNLLADGQHMISNLATVMAVLMISLCSSVWSLWCCCFGADPRWLAGWHWSDCC